MKGYRKLNIKPSEGEKAAYRKKEAEMARRLHAALRPGSDINAPAPAPSEPEEKAVSTETPEEYKA